MSQAQTPEQPVTQAAAEQAGELRNTVQEHAGEVANAAKDQAGQVARTARNETQEVVDRTRRAVEAEARQRTDKLATSMRSMGDGLQALAEGRPQDAGPVAGYARDAASRVGDIAQRLEDRGYDGLIQDVSGFARRRPGVFLASAGLLGFVVGRVVRSGGASGSPSGSSGSGVGTGGARAMNGGPASYALPNQAMADATVSMQPVMPSDPTSVGVGSKAAVRPETR
jgi:hypothetical protein